jgi:hypothetical protein
LNVLALASALALALEPPLPNRPLEALALALAEASELLKPVELTLFRIKRPRKAMTICFIYYYK